MTVSDLLSLDLKRSLYQTDYQESRFLMNLFRRIRTLFSQ